MHGYSARVACRRNPDLYCVPEEIRQDTICDLKAYSLNAQTEGRSYAEKYFKDHDLTKMSIIKASLDNYLLTANQDLAPVFSFAGEGGIQLGSNRSAIVGVPKIHLVMILSIFSRNLLILG